MLLNLFYKLTALIVFLGAVFGMTVGLLFILCMNILGLTYGILLFVLGGALLELGQLVVDECIEPEVLTEEEH